MAFFLKHHHKVTVSQIKDNNSDYMKRGVYPNSVGIGDQGVPESSQIFGASEILKFSSFVLLEVFFEYIQTE